MRLLVALLCGLVVPALSACESPTPRFATGSDSSVSTDGLRQLEKSGFQYAWARPDASFARYAGVWPRYPSGIAYRTPPGPTRPELGDDNYPLQDDLAVLLLQSLRENFRSEVTRDGAWRYATESGPEVLEVRVALIDLVMHAPLVVLGGDDSQWIDSLGAVTLVIEVSDSETGQVLARIAERENLATESSRPIRASPRDARYEASRLFRQWSVRLRTLLDAFKAGEVSAS